MKQNMRVVIIGSRGQLGAALAEEFGGREWDVIRTTRVTCDVNTPLDLPHDIDAIINCAAFHRFDDCEKFPLLTFDTNTVGALNVARAAKDIGALNVYISSDYAADPCNVYAISKNASEYITRAYSDKYLIIRFGSLFGGKPRAKGLSFVDQVLEKAKRGEAIEAVQDVISPAYTKDVAKVLAELIEAGEIGTFNLSNRGKCSFYEFALEIVRQAGYQTKVYPLTNHDPRRPRDVSAQESLVFRTWQEALKEYLEEKR